MRFMLFVKASAETERGILPNPKMFEEMARFNEEMAKAGVLREAEGLHPSSRGARVEFADGARTVVHGPFPDPRNLIAGYWLIETNSMEEAIAWARRSPNPMGEGHRAEIEIRQIYESSDFPAELFPPEASAREQALRDSLQEQPRH